MFSYKWLGKTYQASSSASRFTRYAEKAGEFEVLSVALKDDQVCARIWRQCYRARPLT
jgi:nucleoporin POM152